MPHPFTGDQIPIWIANFVLSDYGSGFNGCSAHDQRDFEFANKYDLPILPVIEADQMPLTPLKKLILKKTL